MNDLICIGGPYNGSRADDDGSPELELRSLHTGHGLTVERYMREEAAGKNGESIAFWRHSELPMSDALKLLQPDSDQ